MNNMTIDRLKNWGTQPTNKKLIKSSPIDLIMIDLIEEASIQVKTCCLGQGFVRRMKPSNPWVWMIGRTDERCKL